MEWGTLWTYFEFHPAGVVVYDVLRSFPFRGSTEERESSATLPEKASTAGEGYEGGASTKRPSMTLYEATQSS